MAENLRTTKYRNGDAIPNLTSNSDWASATTGAYCYYDNDINNAEDYGALYNWYAVSDSRNIAPAGWHVPTDDEWKELEMCLGMSQSEADSLGWRGADEGGKLKEAGYDHWCIPNTGATNESGFSARPGGGRFDSSGNFLYMGGGAYYWSATRYSFNGAWFRSLNYDNDEVSRHHDYKQAGRSIRLIQDN